MTNDVGRRRSDRAERVIAAPAGVIWRALTDPEALARWRPPQGMTGAFTAFEARPGGRYRMVLTYEDALPEGGAKSSERTDVVEGRFEELRADERIVEVVRFDAADPAFAGDMTNTTTLSPEAGGMRVTILCEDVPPGISASDHAAGLASTLQNLAAFVRAA